MDNMEMEYCERFSLSSNNLACGATDACLGCERDNKDKRIRKAPYYSSANRQKNLANLETLDYLINYKYRRSTKR